MINRRKFVGAFAAGLAGIASRRARAREETERRIVGARTHRAAERAADRATTVYDVIDLGEHGWLVIGDYPAVSASALGARSDVKYVEPDRRAVAVEQTTPWGVDRTDAERVTKNGYTGTRAHVAIVDSGIDSDHSDLRSNLGNGKAYPTADGSYAEPWDDDNGHGTHCAGIVAAVDDTQGVLGVGVETTLHAVKVLKSDGYGNVSDITRGITWATDQGHDVISLSLSLIGDETSQSLKDTCAYAYDRGVLVVAAAGNTGKADDVGQPAAYDEVIAVGATRSNDTLAGYSSRGPEVELAAPGSNIYSTIPGGYGYKSGTSMACPHVSGAGAHLMALGYPSVVRTANFADPGGARGRLRDTAENIGLSDNESGDGLLDVEAALADAPTPLGEVGTLSLDQGSRNAWREVSLSRRYTDPVVVMGPVSENGGEPVHARVRNVSPTSFEVQLEEWEYLDGGHTKERVSYLVCEAGSYELADGREIEAGTRTLDDGGRVISFDRSFATRPVVISATQTLNGGQPVVTRQASVSTTGFDCQVQEEEALGTHATETVGYLAVERGVGTMSGVSFEARRTSDSVTDDPSAIDFAQGYDSPVFLAAAQSADGPDPAALRYTGLDGTGVAVHVEEERSADSETNHTTEAVGYLTIDGAGPLYGYSKRGTVGESGIISLDQPDEEAWREVSLDRTYRSPVVVTGPVSENGGEPVHTRVRNVSPTSFEVQLEEWEYLDGSHTTETVDYAVVEAGTYELADGTRIEIGTTDLNERWQEVGFGQSFRTRPVVFSTIQSKRGGQAVVTRQRSVSATGFDCRLQEEQALGEHIDETVGYLAVERGAGTPGGVAIEADRAPETVDENPYRIDFAQRYDRTPVVLCAMQTTNGVDPAALRILARDATGIEVAVEEERSTDTETSHAAEAVGYLAIGGSRLVGD